jgi:hypothetical protein
MMFVFAFIFACSSQPSSPAKQTVAAPKQTSETPVDSAKLAEALQLADAADGVEDKIAHKCAGCALGMDGSPDNAVLVDGVTLHLCSSMCKEEYSKDVRGNTLELLQ